MQTHSHQLKLLQGSSEFFPALIEAFDAAQKEIRLETYIFDFHAESLNVALALEQAALRGVRVSLIVDGVGTPNIPKEWQERWENARVEFKVFDPIGPRALWYPSRWRRLHRKLCVVDQHIGFCGGINILDDHFDPHQQCAMPHARLDFAVQVVGPCVQSMCAEMQRMWVRTKWIKGIGKNEIGTLIRGLKSQQITSPDLQLLAAHNKHKTYPNYAHCHLVLRDNLLNRQSIASAYINAINTAKTEIIIASAFFLPQSRLNKALIQAAKRGVSVTLVLQGHYEFALPYRAARRIYGELMDAGVNIVEYQLTYLHAKVAFVDTHWCTVGSSNLDPLSLLLAREANLVVKDSLMTQELKSRLKIAIEGGGAKVDPAIYKHRSYWERLGDQFSYWLMKLAISVTGKHY